MIPTEKQKLALAYLTDETTTDIGYGGAAGGAKTYLGCYWYMQMGYYAPGTRYYIGRDSLKDTRGSVLKTWSKLAGEIGFTDWKYSDNQILFSNGSEIEFLDLSFYPFKDPFFERFGSKEFTCGWIEEASQVHPLAPEVLRSRIGRWKNKEFNIKPKTLYTFNPRKNWVDTMFYRPYAKGKETDTVKFIQALPGDNPYLPKEYIENLKSIKDKATRERLLYGNFDYDDDPTALISYENICNIWSNVYSKSGEKYIVADIARFGSDTAVITVWDGFKIIDYLTFDISSTTDIQNAINAFRHKYSVQLSNIVVDEDGVGGGIVDTIGCKGFVNNSSANNPAYYNLKSECGYKLAEVIKNIYFCKEISVADKDRIEQELGQLKTYRTDKDSKLQILPKEHIKENIGRSPDWLDVFIMRMYFEVKIGRQQTW